MSDRMVWQKAWEQKKFRVLFISSLFTLLCIAVLIPHFFNFIEARDGKVLNDPLLALLAPRDFSNFTFGLIYSALIIAIVSLAIRPTQLLQAIIAYCLLTILRVICIWLVPLNTPEGIVFLQDPFVAKVGYGGRLITKDLFFSGHVSTIFLLFLSSKNMTLRFYFLLTTIAVASLILVQHVHYTVDVIAAPVFSWLSWRLSFLIKFGNVNR